jgi:hypothetical protein
MKRYRVRQPAAIGFVIALACAVTAAVTFVVSPFGFPWLAWCALGYFAIVTLVKERFTIVGARDSGRKGFRDRRTITILIAYLYAMLFSILGFLGYVEAPMLLIGLAAIFVIDSLIKHAVGDQR